MLLFTLMLHKWVLRSAVLPTPDPDAGFRELDKHAAILTPCCQANVPAVHVSNGAMQPSHVNVVGPRCVEPCTCLCSTIEQTCLRHAVFRPLAAAKDNYAVLLKPEISWSLPQEPALKIL